MLATSWPRSVLPFVRTLEPAATWKQQSKKFALVARTDIQPMDSRAQDATQRRQQPGLQD